MITLEEFKEILLKEYYMYIETCKTWNEIFSSKRDRLLKSPFKFLFRNRLRNIEFEISSFEAYERQKQSKMNKVSEYIDKIYKEDPAFAQKYVDLMEIIRYPSSIPSGDCE